MNEFKSYHPIVNFIYFACVIGFSMFFMHPVCLGISLFCAIAYSICQRGTKALRFMLAAMLPVLIFAAVINPAFNHAGVTILRYFPNGNPLTLESVVYGLAAAVMIVNVICWFSCCNEVMTSDKLIYLFGRIIPSLSLILSMTLRFVPRFCAQMKKVAAAQKCMGQGVTQGSVAARARHGLSILSIMVTWALENSVETADSMKARGYGLKGRSAFSIFTFDRRDKAVLVMIFMLGLYVLAGGIGGKMYFRYFPALKGVQWSAYGVSVFAAYFLLCAMPVIIELREAWRWKFIQSKI